MNLLVGTTNTGKQREVLALFLDTPVHILFPSDFPALHSLSVVETGQTFEENAEIKARAAAAATGQIAAADDSGICVTALDGFPGVLSNRWFTGTSTERVAALLKKMENEQNRAATFVTVVCLYNPETQENHFFRGEVTGSLALTPRGAASEGFEYDFIFIPDGETHTFAELGNAWKVAHSHRTKAFLQLKDFLLKN